MHPHIFEILQFIRKNDITVAIETNGTYCTPAMAREITKCRTQNVSVSIDGSNAVTHDRIRGVEGSFDLAMKGIKNLVNAGYRPQVIMSVMNDNKNQIEEVVTIAEASGAGSVKFNIVMPVARGDKMHKAGETVGIDRLIALGRWVDTELSKKVKIDLYYSYPDAFAPLSHIYGNGNNRGRCSILNILGVLSDGSYALCGIGESVPELKIGYARNDLLADVWNHTDLLNRLREGLPHRLEGVCRTCVMKVICSGSCIAQNYYRHKNVWAPFWFCEDAEKAGLFPVSRQKIIKN